MKLKSFYMVILAICCVLTLISCGNKINKENFDKIETGMTQEEVYKIIGKPTETSSAEFLGLSGTSSKWIKGQTLISIQFFNSKVRLKNFSEDYMPK